MKAEEYMARIIRRETGKTVAASKRLARRIAATQVVRAIKEGPELAVVGNRSYVN